MPLAEDHIFEAVLRFMDRMRGVRSLLSDPMHSSVRLVATTEEIVLEEARRLHANLCLFDYPVDGLVINRLLPASECGTPLLDAWQTKQSLQMATIATRFPELPVWELELGALEPRGVEALASLGADLYASTDPVAQGVSGPGVKFITEGDSMVMSIYLAGFDEQDIDVQSAPRELIVTAGSHRRAIVMPEGLADLRPCGASYDGIHLAVRLERPRVQEPAHV